MDLQDWPAPVEPEEPACPLLVLHHSYRVESLPAASEPSALPLELPEVRRFPYFPLHLELPAAQHPGR